MRQEREGEKEKNQANQTHLYPGSLGTGGHLSRCHWCSRFGSSRQKSRGTARAALCRGRFRSAQAGAPGGSPRLEGPRNCPARGAVRPLRERDEWAREEVREQNDPCTLELPPSPTGLAHDRPSLPTTPRPSPAGRPWSRQTGTGPAWGPAVSRLHAGDVWGAGKPNQPHFPQRVEGSVLALPASFPASVKRPDRTRSNRYRPVGGERPSSSAHSHASSFPAAADRPRLGRSRCMGHTLHAMSGRERGLQNQAPAWKKPREGDGWGGGASRGNRCGAFPGRFASRLYADLLRRERPVEGLLTGKAGKATGYLPNRRARCN